MMAYGHIPPNPALNAILQLLLPVLMFRPFVTTQKTLCHQHTLYFQLHSRITPSTPSCCTVLFVVPETTHAPGTAMLLSVHKLSSLYKMLSFTFQPNSFFLIMLRDHLLGKAFKDLLRESICFLLLDSVPTPPTLYTLSPTTNFNLLQHKISSTQDRARHMASLINAHQIHLVDSSICKILLTALNTHS